MRRAGIPMAYSEGSLAPTRGSHSASPLPIGVTSEAELMDVVVKKTVSPHFFMQNTKPQLPRGLEVIEIVQVPLTAPLLQSQTQFIDYRVSDRSDGTADEIRGPSPPPFGRRESALAPHEDTGPRHYDLRPLIEDLPLEAAGTTFSPWA